MDLMKTLLTEKKNLWFIYQHITKDIESGLNLLGKKESKKHLEEDLLVINKKYDIFEKNAKTALGTNSFGRIFIKTIILDLESLIESVQKTDKQLVSIRENIVDDLIDRSTFEEDIKPVFKKCVISL